MYFVIVYRMYVNKLEKKRKRCCANINFVYMFTN